MAARGEGLKPFVEEIRKGKLAAAYLLYGEDAWQKEEAARAVRYAALPEGEGSFDLVLLEGSSCSLAEVVDAARTLPLFTSRRLVWVKEAEAIRDTAVGGLEEYLRSPSPSSCLLFVAGAKPDFRKALIKTLQKLADVREFQPMKGAMLQGWLRARARALDAEIEPEAAALLEFHAGSETMRLDRELRKAIDFAAPRKRLGVADVEATLGVSATASVFEWVDTTTAGRAAESVSLLRGILAEGEEPVRLLFLLTRQIRMLILGKALSRQGVRGRDLAAAVGFPPFPGLIDKFQGQIARFPEAAGGGAYRKLLFADRSMKSGGRPGAVLERLVLDLRSLAPSKGRS